MSVRSRLRHLWRQVVQSRRLDRELDDELQAYVDLAREERAGEGLPPEEVRRRVLAEVGGIQQVRERMREARSIAVFDPLRQDVRHGLRQMRRAPGFTAAALAVIALGIGATAATVTVVEAVLLRPLPYRDAGDLVAILQERAAPVSPANVVEWRARATSFEGMAAAEFWRPSIGGTDPDKLYGLRVTPELFPLLGVPPALGRTLGDPGVDAREVVLGWSIFQRRFGGDPAVLGRSVVLDGSPYTVVGVMPADFRFAPFWATRAEIWATLDLAPRATSRGESLRLFARLAPGVSAAAAQAEMTTITAALEREFPGTNRGITVTPVLELVVGDVRQPLLVVLLAVSLVLLLACVNVAHMLLARATTREREIAVRAALGAGRGRVVRQLLTESVLLGVVGGAAGIVVAYLGLDVVVVLAGPHVPRIDSVSMRVEVLAGAVALSILTGLIFGLAPALRARATNLSSALRDGDRGATVSRRSLGVRGALIASEIALAAMLLVGAGLALRSFAALGAIDPGFDPAPLVAMEVSVAGSAESPEGRRVAFYQAALARVRALPGVADASAINHLPLAGDLWGQTFIVEGRPMPATGDEPRATFRSVLPRYFSTSGLPLLRGRDFTDADDLDRPRVVIVNEALATTYWPGAEALGQRIRIGFGPAPDWATIVGVAKNAIRSDWTEAPAPEFYAPFLQTPLLRSNPGPFAAYLTFVVRAAGEPAAIAPAIRATIRELAPDVVVSDVHLMRDVVAEATAGATFLLWLLAAFAGVALVLASVGIYGVMSYVVATRRHEIGIRLALGASPRDVLRQVVRQGAVIAVAGTVLGVAAAFAAARLAAGLLYGVAADDTLVFALVPMMLFIVAIAATIIPAWRASRVDTLAELRT